MTRTAQEEGGYTLDSISHSVEQTRRLGMRLGELLRGGELILLEGQLGTGKTTFTQGLALGLDITANINSPTFTLLKEYPGRPRVCREGHVGPALYHFDLYRLDEPAEMFDLGFEEYFEGDGICIVEWAERAGRYWPADHLCVRLKMLSETKRGLLFCASGVWYCELLRQFQKMTYVTPGS
ncbi:MAG TPA: tRNA (adenosine(37)-N6)-threonylcarbamoyltransferase complex ATPase subunit type 1 TsaE [Ktedonobacteraceae bacterium]